MTAPQSVQYSSSSPAFQQVASSTTRVEVFVWEQLVSASGTGSGRAGSSCGSGIAAGADGVILEVHDNPEEAFSDGTESITPTQLKELIKVGKKVASAIDRKL